jgi:hypothetical protein
MSISVIKSIFVRGETDSAGRLKVVIDQEDANLSVGRWQMSVDTLILTNLGKLTDLDIPACVSADHSFFGFFPDGSYSSVQLPRRQLLFMLRSVYRGFPFLVTDNRKEWLDMQTPSNSFNLLFQDALADQPLHLRVQLLLLLTRIN